MIRKIMRYRVKKDGLQDVVKAVEKFVAAVAKEEPETDYVAYQTEEDEMAFLHFMVFPDLEAEEKHRQADHTEKFVKALYPNCEELPHYTELKLVKSSSPDKKPA